MSIKDKGYDEVLINDKGYDEVTIKDNQGYDEVMIKEEEIQFDNNDEPLIFDKNAIPLDNITTDIKQRKVSI